MSQNFQSGNVSISGTVTTSVTGVLPAPSATQTLKCLNANALAGQSIAAGAATTIYTVTAGKTLYISSIHFSHGGTAAVAYGFYNDATLIHHFQVSASPLGILSAVFPTPIKLAAGTTLKLGHNNGAAQTLLWTITGWEE